MKRKFLLICITCILSAQIYLQQANAQVIQSQAVIGGNASDFLVTTCRAADNGFLAVGQSDSDSSKFKSQGSNGLFALWVVKFKLTQTGENRLQWEKTFIRPNQNVYVRNAISCSDGGFLISSRISNGAANDDAWLVKLNAEGDMEWERIFSTIYTDEIVSLSETSDKGFILGADFGFVKIDSTGATQWQNQPDDFYFNGSYLNSVFELKNSNLRSYIAGGAVVRQQADTVQKGELLARTDSFCNPLRQIVYPPDDSLNVGSYLYMTASPVSDGVLLYGLLQENNSGSYYDADIVKVDSKGNFKWRYVNRKFLFDQSGTPQPIVAIPTFDGGYIYGGSVRKSEIYPSDFIVEKLNSNGKLVWSKIIKANESDILHDVKEIKKGLYLISGTSASTIGLDKTKKNFGEADYWFLTLNDTTTNALTIADVRANKLNTNTFKAFPNPSKNILHLQANGSRNVSLINRDGKEVLRTIFNGNKDINISGLPGGLYYIKDDATGFTQKLMIIK